MTEKAIDLWVSATSPLLNRKAFTKTDWMLWAATLDESGESVSAFSEAINKYLKDTDNVACFRDWINTDKPKHESFNHRTVQGGLWMPILFRHSGFL